MESPQRRFHISSVKPASWPLAALPLHAKQLEPNGVNVLACRERLLARSKEDPCTFDYFQTFYFSPSSPLMTVPLETWKEPALLDEDIELLAQRSFIEPLPVGVVPKGSVFLWSIEEQQKGRRRLITEPIDANNYLKLEKTISLCSPQTCGRSAARSCRESRGRPGPFVFTADFAFFYGQFRLPDEVRNFHCFPWRGASWRLTTLPTGGRPCVGLAEFCCRAASLGLAGRTETYIDNTRNTSDDLMQAVYNVMAFTSSCWQLGMQLNESEQCLLAQLQNGSHTFLGLEYDMQHETWKVSQRLRSKLLEAANLVTQHQLTWKQVQKILGLMNTAEALPPVLNKATIDRYYFLKFVRKTARRNLSSSALVTPWQSRQRKWRAMIQRLAADKSYPLPFEESEDAVLVTDASLSGFGAVFYSELGTSVVAGAWVDGLQVAIAERELQAIEEALIRLPVANRKIAIFVDNTEAIAGISRGTLRNFWRMKKVESIALLLKRKNAIFTSVQYVKSEENEADYWSRIFVG